MSSKRLRAVNAKKGFVHLSAQISMLAYGSDLDVSWLLRFGLDNSSGISPENLDYQI